VEDAQSKEKEHAAGSPVTSVLPHLDKAVIKRNETPYDFRIGFDYNIKPEWRFD
jgi:hypothetical protein